MENVISVKNVTKSFNGFQLQDVSFDIKKGYITGFIGQNGAGKTSTIKLIMNLLNKDAGRIEIFGLDHQQHEQEIKERIGFVYADNHFYENISIQDMKRAIAPFYKNWDDTIFEAYIQKFELPKRRKIKHLSKGMKMKFSLAIALAHHAELIIMDEPTSGLDPVFRDELLDILREIMEDEHKTIFFSTHITSDLEQIADYITFIHQGKIVFSAAQDTVLENYRIIKGSTELLDRETRQMFLGIRETPVGFEGLALNSDELQHAFQDLCLTEIPTLEEIMVYTVKGANQHA